LDQLSDETHKTKHRYQLLVEQIQTLIRSGELQVGDRLPPERNLAKTFRVSRNCVREAIRALAEKNLVVSRRGAGTFVTAPSSEVLVDALANAMGAQKDRLRDLFELRKMIEPEIASLAAARITPAQLDRIKVIVFDQQRRVHSGKSDASLDSAFHLALAEASGNRVVQDMMQSLHAVLEDTREDSLRDRARKQASVRAHLKLIDALERGDTVAAREVMLEHVSRMESSVLHMDD